MNEFMTELFPWLLIIASLTACAFMILSLTACWSILSFSKGSIETELRLSEQAFPFAKGYVLPI